MSLHTRSILIFLACLGIALTGMALFYMMLFRAQDAAWQRLQQGEALRVALDPSFPPFDTVDAEGQVAGFDVALAREIGRRLDVPVTFIPIAFDGLADAVIAGKAEAVISAFALDERLTEDVRYSQPYFEAGLVMVTQTGSAISAPEQLADATVAVAWGGRGEAWARKQRLLHILRTETSDEALNAVQSGRADAAILDAVSAALYATHELTILTPPLASEPYVIVLPEQASTLDEAIDQALSEIMNDGTWATLAGRYFAIAPVPPQSGERKGK